MSTEFVPDCDVLCESALVQTDKTALSITNANSLLGASGLVVGGFAGVLISKHPALFSITSGVQCFSLGSSFWCLYILHCALFHANLFQTSAVSWLKLAQVVGPQAHKS
jgi:hypothetical protein